MKKLTVGSLFAGIGGFDLGLERAGFEITWQCEIDEFCRRVLAKHWPHVKRYGDIKRLRYPVYVDVLAGGFPCQDVSHAGRRVGIDGRRSGLWSEFARLIRVVRPRYAIVENVPGLLTRGFGRVLGDLAASGYDAEWDCLPASAFGAPHLRYRVWLVAYSGSQQRHGRANLGRRGSGLLDGRQAQENREIRDQGIDGTSAACAALADTAEHGLESERLSTEGRDGLADATRRGAVMADSNGSHEYRRRSIMQMGRQRFAQEITSDAFSFRTQWRVEPDVGRVAHGVPARVDRLRGLGNAIVPQIAQWIGERIIQAEEKRVSGEDREIRP